MKKMIQNILVYWRFVLIIIVMMIVQAYCDLALPNYTSDIIDVGIQNKGENHIFPEKIEMDEYENIQVFMEDSEKETWTSLYNQKDDFYVLDCKDEDKLDEADEKLLSVIVINYQMGHTPEASFKETLKQTMSQNPATKPLADGIADMSLEDIGNAIGMPITSFEGEDSEGNKTTFVDMRPLMYAMISTGAMDAEGIASAKAKMEEQIDVVGAKTLKSMGVQYAISVNEKCNIDVDKKQMKYIWLTAIKMFVLAFGSLASAIIVSYLASRIGAGIGKNLRGNIYKKVIHYSNTEIEKFSTASLITRATNDVQQLQMVSTLLLRMVLYAPILGIGAVIKVIKTGTSMGWIIFLAVFLITSFVFVLIAIAMPKFKVMQEKVDNVNLVSREILTGLLVIRAFGREDTEEKRFDNVNNDLMKTQLFTNRVMTFMLPGMMLIMNVIVVLITWVSAKSIDNGTLQVGKMTAFITYAMMIVAAFLMLTAMAIFIPRAGVAAERIDEVLNTDSTINNPENPKTIADVKGEIEFKNVSFKYPGAEENVLNELNFKIKPNAVTAIIGGTGSGKSSIINLIPRFYDVSSGSITLDGVDIRDVELEKLRDVIGFVPQKGVLFSGTIDSNLRFGKEDATDEEIENAASIAQATEFISQKENGMQSSIAQGGTNVSGGQKQRLSIARAIAKNPKIYIFDDSFSALDMKTDAMLRKALNEKIDEATFIIVAQRISTIINADQIIVLDEGNIVGIGTHEELIKNCEVYKQIAVSQLSEKELGITNVSEKEDK